MIQNKTISNWAKILLAFLLISSVSVAAETLGHCRAKDSSKKPVVLKIESQNVGPNIRKTVEHFLGGKKVKTEEMEFHAKTLEAIHYRLEDLRSGQIQEFQMQNGGFSMILKKSRDSETKKEFVKASEYALFPGNLLSYLFQHSENMKAGERISFPLLATDMQDVYNFRSQLVSRTQEQITMRVEPDSWLLRKLVPEMIYRFDPKGKLVFYKGPTLGSTSESEFSNTVECNFE